MISTEFIEHEAALAHKGCQLIAGFTLWQASLKKDGIIEKAQALVSDALAAASHHPDGDLQ
jgi:hypothetical protein